ncbi:DMT family transporter [Propylenella binzhouense]|uniref:DMT family transporter n=1 Tax=Propylenella binzhouense TaxID=2555902 RepID=UPI0031B60F0C
MTPLFGWLGRQPYLLLSLSSLFWAGNAVVGRWIAGSMPPVALAQFRWVAAFLILLPLAIGQIRRDWRVVRRHLAFLAFLSFAGISVFNTLLYWGLHYTTAINASLMQSTAPLLIGLWSFLLYRDRLTLGQVGGILTSLFGVFVIVVEGDPARAADFSVNIGDIAVIVAMSVYSLYSALLRRRPGVGPLTFATLTMGIGAFLLLPLFALELAFRPGAIHLNAEAASGLLYVIIFPSVAAYLCFNRGVELVGPNRAGPFFHLVPLFGTGLAIVLLGEQPALFHAVGAALILSGVFIATRRPRARIREPGA